MQPHIFWLENYNQKTKKAADLALSDIPNAMPVNYQRELNAYIFAVASNLTETQILELIQEKLNGTGVKPLSLSEIPSHLRVPKQ